MPLTTRPPKPSLTVSVPAPPSTSSSSITPRIVSWGSSTSSSAFLSASRESMTALPSPVPGGGGVGWGEHYNPRENVGALRDQEEEDGRVNKEMEMDKGKGKGKGTSKTTTFFDSATMKEDVPAPPPNPPSRSNSIHAPSSSAASSAASAIVGSAALFVARSRGGRVSEGGVGTGGGGTGWLDRDRDRDRDWDRDRRIEVPTSTPTGEGDDAGWGVHHQHHHSTTSRRPSQFSTLAENPHSPSVTFDYDARSVRLSGSRTASEEGQVSPRLRREFDIQSPSPTTTTTTTTTMRGVGEDEREPTGENGTEEEDVDVVPLAGDWVGNYQVVRLLGKGAFSRVALARLGKGKERETGTETETSGEEGGEKKEQLYALKLVSRKSYDHNPRMKTAVVREISVLKHLHHPSLITLHASFSTATYAVLVLSYAPAGELFDFLAAFQPRLTPLVAKRIFSELCGVVGWLHEVGCVHRDIKLENILLLSSPFPLSSPTSPPVLPSPSVPLLQLTDFGLSRFLPSPTPSSPSSTLLTTRCGSEAYAAPELILGKPYDGIKTDAWAVGVVLFAVVTGGMPFVEVEVGVGGLESEERIAGRRTVGQAQEGAGTGAGAGRGAGTGRGRKAYLLRIAKGEYTWPITPDKKGEVTEQGEGVGKLLTHEVKAVVSALLTRDPEKRAKVGDVWGMEWLREKRGEEGRLPRRVRGSISERAEGEPDGVEVGWRAGGS